MVSTQDLGQGGSWGLQSRASRPRCVPPGNLLFFGCRSRHQDFYWAAEWLDLEKRGCLTLFTAFSREQVGVLGGVGRGRDAVSPPAPCHVPIGAEGVCATSDPGARAAGVGPAGAPGRLLLPGRVSLGRWVGTAASPSGGAQTR